MSKPEHDEHHDDHGHQQSRFIQHHYDDAQHQFDSGKLGIWFFLVQEILFFSALFVAYVLYRHHRPEIYAYAHHYLDVKWGAINTAVLIVSSLVRGVGGAVRPARTSASASSRAWRSPSCARSGSSASRPSSTRTRSTSTSCGVATSIRAWRRPATRCINKGNSCPGTRSAIKWDKAASKAASGCLEGDYDYDKATAGIQSQCKVAVVKGAQRTSIPACEMPQGNPVRGKPAAFPCYQLIANHHVCPSGPAALVRFGDHGHHTDVTVEATCEVAPPPPAGPADAFADVDHQTAPGAATFTLRKPVSNHDASLEFASGPPPAHTNMFFSIYFAMTGLHGIHVLVGVFIFIWLLYRAIRGDFTPEYFGPIDYAALYWHLVDLIWIFLFPLLYLIH
jgi:cytochrome c oxidase subunit 3